MTINIQALLVKLTYYRYVSLIDKLILPPAFNVIYHTVLRQKSKSLFDKNKAKWKPNNNLCIKCASAIIFHDGNPDLLSEINKSNSFQGASKLFIDKWI